MSLLILIVDDEPAVTDLLAYNLRKAHYDVLTAADGREALRLALESKPDLILLDLMMPKMDGIEVCRRLRADPDFPFTPSIMVTALADQVGHESMFVALGVHCSQDGNRWHGDFVGSQEAQPFVAYATKDCRRWGDCQVQWNSLAISAANRDPDGRICGPPHGRPAHDGDFTNHLDPANRPGSIGFVNQQVILKSLGLA